jgi:hypothetical protein
MNRPDTELRAHLHGGGGNRTRIKNPLLRVLQRVYEPTVTPGMLRVLTDRGLTVLRDP